MKTCTKCKLDKPEEEFAIKGNGWAAACKVCFNAWYRSYYISSQQDLYKAKEEARKKRVRAIQRRVEDIKSRPCADCGFQYPPWIMDFDHVRGEKKDNVATLIQHHNLQVVLREIAKCDVVCSNCHRERTHQRKLQLAVI